MSVLNAIGGSKKLTPWLLLLYYYLLRVAYGRVSEIYNYFGYEYSTSIERTFVAIALCIGLTTLTLFTSFRRKEAVNAIGAYVLILLTIPALVYYEYTPNLPLEFLVGYSILPVLFVILTPFIPSLKTGKLRGGVDTQLAILVVLTMLLPFLLTYGFRFNPKIFLLEGIHDVRIAAREKANVFTGYFYNWLSRGVLPFLLVVGLDRKDLVTIGVSIISTLYLFTVSAHKSVFFGLFIVLFFYFTKGYWKQVNMLLLGILSVLGFSSIYSVFNSGVALIEGIVINRLLFVPVEVGSNYFNFFKGSYTYWSQTPLNPFMTYPHDVIPPYLIGRIYYNMPQMSANAGIIPEGYMNYGLVGILINCVLLSLFIGVIINHRNFTSTFMSVVFIYVIAIQNGAMTTSVLTGGMFIPPLLFFFFNIKSLRS